MAITLRSGITLHYRAQGPATGPALILLHGFTDSSFSFSRVLPLLPPSVRVIVPDQRGHGRSDRTPGDYSMDALARDVVELMDALNVPTATIVGHSMGSFVARRVAWLAPGRISRLVLVGAGLSATNSAVREVQQSVAALSDPVDPGFVREFQYSTIALPVPEAFMDTVIAESLRLDAATMQGLIDGMTTYAPAEPEIAVPVLVVGGDRDVVFPLAEQQALARAIRGAEMQTLPGVGHTPQWEVPDAFVAALGVI
jgi:non-heme chloroperoxidase